MCGSTCSISASRCSAMPTSTQPMFWEISAASSSARCRATSITCHDTPSCFFRHSLSCFVTGDLFVLDVQRAYAPAENPEEIRRRDPGILNGLTAAHAEWLSGPFLRYSRDVTDVAFRIELNTNCPVPGSYALEAIATVRLTGRRQKEFSAFRFKRYDIGRLADCLSTLGWERVADLPYGAAGETPVHTLLLFRKR